MKSTLLSSIPGIEHGFGDIRTPIPEALSSAWEKSAPIWKQVHGNAFTIVDRPQQECGEVDTLISFSSGLPVGVRTADCAPILLAKKDGKKVAAIHAGWRGTLSRAAESAWLEIERRGEKPENWVAAIGPCARECCYEVGEDLYRDFEKSFGLSRDPKKFHLDVGKLNRQILEDLGFDEIDDLEKCTICCQNSDGPLFHSFRREKKQVRQYSIISIHS